MSDAPQHLIKSYEQEFVRLQAMMTELGALVKSQLIAATASVLDRDQDAAMRAVRLDPSVDALEFEIEQFAIGMIALRQPVGLDLRKTVGALKMTGGLERIGDYAANIARRSLVLQDSNLPSGLASLKPMAALVDHSLENVLAAYSEEDSSRAEEVWVSDQQIDYMYNALFRECITYMMEDPRNITPCTHLLFIAKNLERIGDHTTNLAETVHYVVTGSPLTEPRPKTSSVNEAV